MCIYVVSYAYSHNHGIEKLLFIKKKKKIVKQMIRICHFEREFERALIPCSMLLLAQVSGGGRFPEIAADFTIALKYVASAQSRYNILDLKWAFSAANRCFELVPKKLPHFKNFFIGSRP